MVEKRRRKARQSDQGAMDDVLTERVMRTAAREVDRVARPGRRDIQKAGRMVQFANRLQDTLQRQDAMPAREADRSLIGDLAELELRVARLQRALQAFVASPRSKAGREPFENRLVKLASEVDAVRAVVRDLKRPLSRLLKERCGNVGLAAAALTGATATLE